jgi:hypothetical protein
MLYSFALYIWFQQDIEEAMLTVYPTSWAAKSYGTLSSGPGAHMPGNPSSGTAYGGFHGGTSFGSGGGRDKNNNDDDDDEDDG